MQQLILCSDRPMRRLGAGVSVLIVLGCACVEGPIDAPPFVFACLDVGQGLAQVGVVGSDAIAWDCGFASGYKGWREGYLTLGSPRLAALVISHSDMDHLEALCEWEDTLGFSGCLVTHPFEDTALIRQTAGQWGPRLSFRTMSQGDTLGGLPGVHIECLWPPGSIQDAVPLTESHMKNRYSLCFLVTHGNCRVLITSDIDSVATKQLGITFGHRMQSQAFVVPHHGSRSALDPVFLGYVAPEVGVISCSDSNTFGHPAEEILDLLFQMRVDVKATFTDGHVTGRSNGDYWEWE